MIKLSFRILTMVISLCFTGTAENLSRKSSIFLRSEYQWNEYPLANGSTKYMGVSQRATVDISFGFFRVLIQPHKKREVWNIKHLDLSKNLVSKLALGLPAHLLAVETLNLSNNAILSISLGLPGPPAPKLNRHRGSFPNGLAALKVLLLQRNELRGTPEGLWKLKSLQSLDLSFNGILQIGLSDFHNCLQLENIYLKSNKIFKIHPEAFKDLKKLQVVDLSNNALSAILPLLTIALELPHLEVDLSHNQWQCEESIVDFQNLTSESWRKKWNVICNKSIGNDSPKNRISREVHLPHPAHGNHIGSLILSEAEKPQEGMSLSTLGEEAVAGSALGKMQSQQLTGVRIPRDGQAAGRKEEDPPNFILAICLSVLITFMVAFCIGAFSRPYIDTLWQQRCQNKNPDSDDAFSNEGFYDDIETARNMQHQGIAVPQASHHPDLYENQNPSWNTEPSPYATAILGRTLRNDRQEYGSQQRPAKWDSNEAGNRDDDTLPNGQAVRSALHRYQNVDNHELMSSAQNHIYNNILKELHYDTVAQEQSLYEGSMSSTVSSVQTCSSSTHSGDEFDMSHTRGFAASLSSVLAHTFTHGAGESEERQCPKESHLSTMGLQMKSCKEIQDTLKPRLQGARAEENLSTFYRDVTHNDPRGVDPPAHLPRWIPSATPVTWMPTQKESPFEPALDLESNYDSDSDEGSLFTLSSESSEDKKNETKEQGPGRENGGASQSLSVENLGEHQDSVSTVEKFEDNNTFQRVLEKYKKQVTHSDPRGVDPPARLPRWVTSATLVTRMPAQKESPLEPALDLESNYDSDSDKGSLFTLSSESSEDKKNETKEQGPGRENGGASQPLSVENLGEHKDSVSSVEKIEDNIQRILEKYKSQVTHSDPKGVDPLARLPRWVTSDTPVTGMPAQKESPFEPALDQESNYSNYDSDSDEGSLSTLSSESSEDKKRETKEQGPGRENGGASQPLSLGNLGEHKDSVSSVEKFEDNIQRILEKYKTQKDGFGNPFTSGPVSGLCETPLESSSNSSESEDSLTWPPSQEVDWHYSPRALRFSNLDISPPYYASDV